MDKVWSSSRLRVINLCQFANATLNYAEVWPGDKDNNLYVTADTSLQSNRKGIQNIQSWCEAQDTSVMQPSDPCITGEGSGSPPQPAHAASNMNWEIIPRDQCKLIMADRTVGPQQIACTECSSATRVTGTMRFIRSPS